MKKIIALFIALTGWLRATEEPIDLDTLLTCIAQVEGADTSHIGSHGERSRYQITQAVWHDYTHEPFTAASSKHPHDLELQHKVAMKHIEYLASRIDRPSVYRIAAAWNGGINAVNKNRFNDRMASYAKRVRNLYRELSK